jgi:HK97 gp10 family phage protein
MAGIGVKIKMEGLAELKKRLAALQGADTAIPIKAALRGTGALLKKKLVAAAPVDQDTQDAIHINENVQNGRSRRNSKPGVEVVTVGIKYGKKKLKDGRVVKSEGDAFYWKFLEFGTQHQAAEPFIRPTFEANKEELAKEFEKKMAASIKRLEKKYGNK